MVINEKILDHTGMSIKADTILDSSGVDQFDYHASLHDQASEISVAATAVNYTAATADVEAHLGGIDTALGDIPTTAADIAVAATAVNYSPATADVEAHLAAIDTVLGTLLGG